jgi:hypothetical protein
MARSGRGAGGDGVGLDQVEDHRVGDEPGLDDLGEAADEVVDREGVQRGEVAEDSGGRVERADEVLAFGGVDAGLAADCGVHHAEHGGRYGDPAHPAQPGRGDEAGEVGGGTAADADDHIGAGEVGLAERLPAVRRDLDGLGLLGIGQLDGDRLVALGRQVLAQRLAGGGQRFRVQYGDALGSGADQAGQLAEELVADEHLVRCGARGAAYGEPGGGGGGHTVFSSSASITASATSSGVRPSVLTTARATSV